jgi:hypothetical protein
MKKLVVFAMVVAFLAVPLTAFGTMGQMSPKSKDINVEFFGSMKTYPIWTSNLNFNSDTDVKDFMLDENGVIMDHVVRNELRMGWKGGNDSFDFMIILEADFNLNKPNGDRGSSGEAPDDSGMTGEDFGVEKLDIGYNFGLFRIHSGWTTRWLDLQTGGLVYGDDHPYIGLTGNIGENFKWEADYTIVWDTMEDEDTGDGFVWPTSVGHMPDGDNLDWRVYSVKGMYTIPTGFAKGFVISPFYAYSDNDERDAQVSYIGLEGYGKIGMFTPRFEIAYADGDKDIGTENYDISAMAAYASVDVEICPGFVPYFGIRWEEGDDDPDDDDINAFNSITDIARYTPTFGMENAIVYRYVPVLGTHLYSGNFNVNGDVAGYGGISNSSKADAPGLMMWGLGVKGKYGQWSYKIQYMDFSFDEEPEGIDDEVGQELDFRVAYTFSKHFTVANCFAAFEPGDAIEDAYGTDYDDTALVNTIELIWSW